MIDRDCLPKFVTSLTNPLPFSPIFATACIIISSSSQFANSTAVLTVSAVEVKEAAVRPVEVVEALYGRGVLDGKEGMGFEVEERAGFDYG